MFTFATKLAPERPCLELASELGFEHVELWLSAAMLDEVDQILDDTADLDLKYVLHFPNDGDLQEQQLAQMVRLYRALDAWALVIHQPMMERYGRRLLRRGGELICAVENGVLDPEEFEDWSRGNTFLTLDIEHLWKHTLSDVPMDELLETLELFWESHGSRVKHIHLPGYRVGGEEHRPISHHAELGSEVWDFLQKRRYQGMVVSEIDAEHQHAIELRKDLIFFQRWERERGRGTEMRRLRETVVELSA